MQVFNGIDPTFALLAPPLTPPFSHRGGVSSYGVRRWRDSKVTGFDLDYPSVHEGVDLVPAMADDEGAVYASFWGLIVDHHVHHEDGDPSKPVVNEDLTLWCDPAQGGLIVQYLHIVRTKQFRDGTTVSSGVSKGDRVRAGQLLGFISPHNNDPHLHFELRLQADVSLANQFPIQAFSNKTPITSTSVDPTMLLYRFDAERWPRQRNAQIEEWATGKYLPISRLRIVPWVVQHKPGQVKWHTHHFLEVMFEVELNDFPANQSFYVPLETGIPREQVVADVLRDAFNHRHKVKLRGRKSWFFGERLVVEDIRVRPS